MRLGNGRPLGGVRFRHRPPEIWHRWWWRNVDDWSEWHPFSTPAGTTIAAITAGSHDNHHHEIIAVDTNGTLHNRWYTDTWSDRVTLG